MEQMDLFPDPAHDQDPPWAMRDHNGLLRPRPPEGYVAVRLPRYAGRPCPLCKRPYSLRFLGVFGFTDPGAQAFADELERLRDLPGDERPAAYRGLDLWSLPYEGDMIKLHRSRYSTGETGCCGALIWHDDVSGYFSIQGKVRYVDWAAYARLRPRTAEDT